MISVQNQHQKAVIRGFDSIMYLLYGDFNYAFVAILEIFLLISYVFYTIIELPDHKGVFLP